jgi:hypothetical protein
MENLISAGLVTNNHEQTNYSGINNNNNLQDMMAWNHARLIPLLFKQDRKSHDMSRHRPWEI